MAGRVFLGFFPRTSYSYFAPRLNSCVRIGYRPYSTSEKVKTTVKDNFKEMQSLNFEQFKETKVKSFEEFKQSPRIQALFNDMENNMEKVAQAYEDYCVCKFNRHRLAEHGGNPGTMI